MAAYAAGDAAAARALTARLAPRALGQAYRMMGSQAEAEEVTQEALLRLWRQAPRWEAGRAKVGTWLYRVVANLCTDRLRRRPTLPLDAVPEPLDVDQPSADGALLKAARHRALSEALARLPARQAEAVALRHLEGLSVPEVAAVMDIGVRAAESLMARGRKGLQSELAGRKADLGFTDDTT